MLLRLAVILFIVFAAYVIFLALNGVAETGVCPVGHPRCGVPEGRAK